MPDDFFTDFRNVTKIGSNKATHSLEMSTIFIWQYFDIEFFFEIVNIKKSINIPRMFISLNDLRGISNRFTSISPKTSLMMSKIVIKPTTPPYSSSTTASFISLSRNFFKNTKASIARGTNIGLCMSFSKSSGLLANNSFKIIFSINNSYKFIKIIFTYKKNILIMFLNKF